MNYFEHHIGDYDEATAHLTACEDGIYSRLIRKYYATERPLIADIAKLQRLVRANSRAEKQAVVDVLEEFFHLEDDGWHQDRCDEVIAAYLAGEPEREVKKANEDNRLKRHREERARLFKSLTDAGQHAPWNVGMAELRELVKRVTATVPETDAPPLPETAHATPATATQEPVPNTQTPDTRVKGEEGADPAPPTRAPAHTPTRAGQAVLRMKQAGLVAGISPSHPKLLALLEAGITDDELADAAAEAVAKGKPFSYALAIAEGRRRDAADTGALPAAPPPGRRTAVDRQIATMNALTGKDRSHGPAPAADHANVVDVDARVVP